MKDENISEKSEVSLQEKEKVEKMLEKLIEKRGKDDNKSVRKSFKIYQNIIDVLVNWKQDDQEPIIRKILDEKIMDRGTKGIGILYSNKKELFSLMQNWSFEKSHPLVEKELDENLQKKDSRDFFGNEVDFVGTYKDIAPAIYN